MKNPFWTQSVPIWVSRKTADGLVVAWTVQGWMFMLLGFVLLANLLGWSIVGLVELVQYVIQSF